MTLMTDEAHVTYCREARRLRCVHARRPARMLREIADLSQKYDAIRPAGASKAAIPAPVRPTASSPRPIFAEKVSAELTGELLTYSKRQALIAEADRMGIGRFDANLLIAEAQHRAKTVVSTVRRARRPWTGAISIVLAAEAAFALVLYHLFI